MSNTSTEATPRRTLWDLSALVYAKTYNDDSHGVDEQVLARLSENVNDGTILDAGCGPGVVVRKLLERGARRVVGVDISAPMLEQLPVDDRVRRVHADLSPSLIRRLARETEAGAFDLVIFKRSLYQSPEKARASGGRGFRGNFARGRVVIVHPETGLHRYLASSSRGAAALTGHALYHAFNRLVSRALDALKVHEYRTYSLGELLQLAAYAAPSATVDVIPVRAKAFNVVTLTRAGV